MAKDQSKNKDSKYGMYVKNLGKVGTFYKDKKDTKGVEAILHSITADGVYGTVKGKLFPSFFVRADFNTGGIFKCNCGKTYELREVSAKSSKKGSSKNSKGYSDDGDHGSFGTNGKKKAQSLISFLNKVEDLDQHDDDDWSSIVEAYKKSLKAFK